MAPDNRIIVVSTYTVDLVPVPGGEARAVPGGPAHYIGQALDRLRCRHTVITGDKPTVEVVTTDEGEQYVIPPIAPIAMPAALEARAVILSPIVAEIDPEAVPPVHGLLVIDLQGFVREPGKPLRDVTRLFDLTKLLTRADIVKAAKEELERLTDSSRAALAGCTVLVTEGRRGATILARGETVRVAAEPVEAPHTIGAGDAFLAAFTVSSMEGASLREAGEQAARFTERFLRRR
jgi:hypothetical protein